MNLTIAEAARLLGKSERQLRYLIQTKRLPARKVSGRWELKREDLPLTKGQAKAQEVKERRAAQAVLDVLGKAPVSRARDRYSVRELRAYQKGAPLYRELLESVGADHPATAEIKEALMLLACGCHEYHPREKAHFYARAREQASRAAMSLLLGETANSLTLVDRVEKDLLPAIGGLIRRAERRKRA